MSVIGQPDLDRPISLDSGRLYYPFGGGSFHLEPGGCGVMASDAGLVEMRLDLLRALPADSSRATLWCTIGAEYASDTALALVRDTVAGVGVIPIPLTDWWLRIPTPPSTGGRPGLTELAAPMLLASNGLGTAQLVQSLSVDSALVLEELLNGDGPLEGVAEASFAGASPRLPVAVRFDPSELLAALRDLGDAEGAMPRRFIVDYFARDTQTLPIALEGDLDSGSNARFADAMTDRIVGRFGAYIPSQELSDAPVVRLDPPTGQGRMIWALAQPFLAERRIVLAVDLVSAAQKQIDRLGAESVIHRRTMAPLPPLGRARFTALANLPTSRVGVEALGVTLTFPPHPPERPQARTVSAEIEAPDDMATLDVQLSPGEPQHYRASTFVVLADADGVRQLDGPESAGAEPILHLSPADFAIDIACIEMTPALAALAIVTGTCTYELEGRTSATRFALDGDRRRIGIAVPRERAGLSIEAVALARDGSAELALPAFDSLQARLDVTSFATYGPQHVDLRCVFDDAATIRAVQVRPSGTDGPADDLTTLSFTRAVPLVTYRWFALSPFRPGFQYRPLGGGDGTWTDVTAGGGTVTVFSSQLQELESIREVAASSTRALAEPARHLAGRRLESEPVTTETAVEPVGVSPVPEPTDEILYPRVSDATRKLFVPRYGLDVQTVSGRQRYRIAMTQGETTSTLQVNLLALPAPTIAEQARDAEEYPHTLGVFLDFLVAVDLGIRKRLEFTEVSRNGQIVTAALTFATLAERDDVYRAMTEPGRQARLIVRRTIDVSVPQEVPPDGSGPIDTVPDMKLPVRPLHHWPPDQVVLMGPIIDKPVFDQPIIDTPILATLPPEPGTKPTIALGPRGGGLNATLAAVDIGSKLAFARFRESGSLVASRFVPARLMGDDLVLKRRPPDPSIPSHRPARLDLEEVVDPDPFVFMPSLHGYIFAGLSVGSGGNNQLIRYRLQWQGTFHTYLQDASRPSDVYVFADEFRIARRHDAPFTPFVTVRVSARPDDGGTDVVFDYVVAPYTDARRLADARTRLLADPRIGADHLDFQPLLTNAVRYFIDRPTAAGSVHEARPSASVVLQGALKDTLTMSLADFRVLFDAMHGRTASLFVGQVEVDVPPDDVVVIPFVARMDHLQGEMFSYEAASAAAGAYLVKVRNEIESPVTIQTLDPTIVRDGTRTRGTVQGGTLPVDRLAPGAAVHLTVAPETTAAGAGGEVVFDLGGVSVIPDPAAIWDSILDRTTVEYYRTVTVKAIATLFDPVAGREAEQILHILVAFEDGDTADLHPSNLEARVRVDHPIDDVILGRPVDPAYRYTVTVIRSNGQQDLDPEPRHGTADLFFVSVVK